MSKKILSLLIVSILLLTSTIGAFARPKENISNNIEVHSQEFPNAYIESNFIDINSNELQSIFKEEPDVEKNINALKNSDEVIGVAKATVFYEENYKQVNGEKICTDSRLLSKKEVNAIGKENFKQNNLLGSEIVPANWSSRGMLNLYFTVSRNLNTSHAIEYKLHGTANWENGQSRTGDYPSDGEDYMGFAWGGGFATDNGSAIGRYITTGGKYDGLVSIWEVDSTPNVGVVWGFEESKWLYSYAELVDTFLTLSKNKLTGQGNTTSAILKYIHTYTATRGTISISGSSAGVVTGGFSLSGVSKQWSLSVRINNLKY